MELTDGDAEEAEGWVANASGHFADLAVAAFAEGEFDPAGRDALTKADGRIARRVVGANLFGFGGESSFFFDDDTLAQLLQRIFGHLPFDLRPVSAGMGVFRIEEFGVQSGFVGKKKESFAVAVEASERVDVFRELEFGQRALSGMIRRKLREDAVGFVECQEHSWQYSVNSFQPEEPN